MLVGIVHRHQPRIDLCNRALEAVRGLVPPDVYETVSADINLHDEWGLGMEILIDTIVDLELSVSPAQFALIAEAMQGMGLGDSHRLAFLREQIAPESSERLISDDDDRAQLEDFIRSAALQFADCRGMANRQRSVCAKYLRDGLAAGASTGELVDFLAVSSPSILERAGYSEEEIEVIAGLVASLSDGEIAHATNGEDRNEMTRASDRALAFYGRLFAMSERLAKRNIVVTRLHADWSAFGSWELWAEAGTQRDRYDPTLLKGTAHPVPAPDVIRFAWDGRDHLLSVDVARVERLSIPAKWKNETVEAFSDDGEALRYVETVAAERLEADGWS